MAITIKSQPDGQNCSKTNLVYNISSSNADKPQFRYIMDIYIQGTSDKLSRVTQFPDPQLEAVLDPSRIINDNLEYYTDFSLKPFVGYNLISTPAQKRAFTMKFGEEYGTSPSSSVTVYPDLITDDMDIFPCQVDVDNGVSFNFEGGLIPTSSTAILSDRPDGVDDFIYTTRMLSFYNGESVGGTLYLTESYSPTGGTYTQGVGYERVRVTELNVFANENVESLTYTFNGDTQTRGFKLPCENLVYNFMFINRYGVWENYQTDNVPTITTNVSRDTYDQTFVNYGTDGAYDVTRRGEKQYNASVEDTYTISTNWLSKDEAQWLTQLIESDSVYVATSNAFNLGSLIEQFDDIFLQKPIVITNSNYIENTGRKDQKNFKYDISFQYANQRIGR